MALTKDDLAAIAKIVQKAQPQPTPPVHVCRFPRVEEIDLESLVHMRREISEDDIREAVKFYKNFNRMVAESGKTVRTLVLTLGVTGAAGLLLVGLWAEIKSRIGS